MVKVEFEIESDVGLDVRDFYEITRLFFTIEKFKSMNYKENGEVFIADFTFDREPKQTTDITEHPKYDIIKMELNCRGSLSITEAQRLFGVGYTKAMDILDHLCEIGHAQKDGSRYAINKL